MSLSPLNPPTSRVALGHRICMCAIWMTLKTHLFCHRDVTVENVECGSAPITLGLSIASPKVTKKEVFLSL